MSTVYKCNLRTHLKKRHQVQQPQIGEHYLDKSLENRKAIEELKEKCFIKRSNSNCKHLKCKKCGLVVSKHHICKLIHCLIHVSKETDVKWLYSCLLCPEERSYRSVNKANVVRRHMKNYHGIWKPERGIHYSDRSKQFSHIIKPMFDQCFKNAKGFTKQADFLQCKNITSASIIEKSNTFCNVLCVKCSICNVDIENVEKKKKCHIVKHLPDETKVRWLYECLVCKKTKCIYRCFMKKIMQRHIYNRHGRTAAPGVHYADLNHKYSKIITKLMAKCFASSSIIICCREITGIACTYCGVRYHESQWSDMRYHSLAHLPKESDTKWLFSCLLCTSKSIYYASISRHVISKHKITNPRVGKDFTDRRLECQSILRSFVIKCFPSDTWSRKEKLNKLEKECRY